MQRTSLKQAKRPLLRLTVNVSSSLPSNLKPVHIQYAELAVS